MSFVENEVGPGYRPGGIALVGRDPGYDEVRAGRPFVGVSGRLLDDALREAGIRRGDCAVLNTVRYQPPGNRFEAHPRARVEAEVAHLRSTLERLGPSVVVALGNEAAFALLGPETWPSRDGSIYTAYGIEERRGYAYDSPFGAVIACVHPAAAARQWVPYRTLVSFDLQRAKELHGIGHLRRPRREVEIVATAGDARRAVGELRRYGRVAVDIEVRDERTASCIGFAGESGRAFVFTEGQLDGCRGLLEDVRVGKVFQNGLFDLYFLYTRLGLRVGGFRDDTLLAWHACYPELAGTAYKVDGRRKLKVTRKSLAFLASLFTYDEWWKDYDTDEEGMLELNGRDCCITLDIMQQLDPLIDSLGVRPIYEHEVGLVWPCVEMQARGLRVDNHLRLERLHQLHTALQTDSAALNEMVVPLLEDRAALLDGNRRLFEKQEGVCPCCRHASKKQGHCWGCAGFEKAPSKKELVEWIEADYPGLKVRDLKKAELESDFLFTCRVCEGKSRREWLEFNPASDTQQKVVLYDLLKMPKRFNQGKLTSDEDALRSLLQFTA